MCYCCVHLQKLEAKIKIRVFQRVDENPSIPHKDSEHSKRPLVV